MLMPHLFQDFAIWNIGRAGWFTCETADTFGGVVCGPGIRSELPFGLLTPQSETTAGRIVLVSGELIGRTDLQTESTVDAVREQFAQVGVRSRRMRRWTGRGQI